MKIDVVYRPHELEAGQCAKRTVVVFDVLRATTTITSALACGVRAIRLFASPAEALAAKDRQSGEIVLCGEEHCLPPAGFDLGNSPGVFSSQRYSGRTIYMSTTNGTRALLAAADAAVLLVGALVNARAVAGRLAAADGDVILLCAGTNGQIAMEDILGAGAVLAELQKMTGVELSDAALVALRLFQSVAALPQGLLQALRDSAGGRNVIAAGLGADIEFAARLNAFDVAPQVKDFTACISAHPAGQTTLPADSTPT